MTEATARREDPKEEIILDAAKTAFMEHGYAATSMDLVAQTAHVSKTTLYARFPSKESLFAAAIAAECERRGLSFSPAHFADLSIEDALRRIGTMLVDLLWSPEALRMEQIVTGEASRFPEVAEIFFRSGPSHVMETITAYFVDAVAKGKLGIPAEEAEFAATQFITSFKGKLYCELLMGVRGTVTPEDRESFVARAVDLFLTGAGAR